MATQQVIHSHSYQHFEDLQLSSNEFYTTLETLIANYEYPKVTCKRVSLKVGGMFSSKREYLCVSKDNYHFFICASPFGRSFFISWWLHENEGDFFSDLFGRMSKRQKSLFEMDSETMFRQSIHTIVNREVNRLMEAHGLTVDNAELVN